MTFLLFLASIALLEYLVRDTGQKSGDSAKPHSTGLVQVIEPESPAADTATSDLLALGQALNMQEQVQAPDSERVTSPIETGTELTKP